VARDTEEVKKREREREGVPPLKDITSGKAAIIFALGEGKKSDAGRRDKTARRAVVGQKTETCMMNKKDSAMRKIYLSYCYARNEKEGERHRAERMDIPAIVI
jgi:hypothetical protein